MVVRGKAIYPGEAPPEIPQAVCTFLTTHEWSARSLTTHDPRRLGVLGAHRQTAGGKCCRSVAGSGTTPLSQRHRRFPDRGLPDADRTRREILWGSSAREDLKQAQLSNTNTNV